ncbi:MAG TPA: AsmA family protein [Steroidobacteraceae bacterium]|nr:AsmA family protein [Steroidobacteraceae bacterium]
MRNLKLLGVLAGGIVALLGAVLLGVWLLVNPNAYKGRIAAAVQESTGRELKLQGDIKLSVIPWVALELGPASLGNPPGFSDEPFLSFTHASVRVRLLPLLRQRLEVARVEVEGLDLRLRKNAAGRGNWQGVEPEQPPTKSDVDHTAAWGLESLANIRIDKGRVAYEGITVEKFDLETGSLASDQHIPVNLTFDANRAPAGEQLSLNAKFDLSQDAAQKPLRFSAVHVSGTLNRSGDERPAHWELSAPEINVNVTEQTLAAQAFDLSYSGAHLTGSARATKIIDDLGIAGSLNLAPLVLREMEPRLGFPLPKTRDPKALSRLSASTDFAYDSAALALTHLQLHLDDTQLQGNLKLLSGDTQVLQFDLAIDQINLDRYRAPEAAAVAPQSASPAPAAQPEKILDASGTLTIKSAQFARLDLSNVRVTVAAKGRVMHLFPVEAEVDGGRSSGDITLDSRGATPTLNVDEQLTGIDMARLLANTAGKGRLSGRATLNLKATARGASIDAMLKTLTGHLDANLADGALEGIDVGYELSLAQALIDKSAPPSRASTGHTPFQAFKLSSQITNGIAETHDLTIASQAVKVAGQGSANLATKGIDFKLLASLVTAPARNTDIPLRVTGTYANPTVRPDIEGLAKDQLKQKLQDVLKKNGLQGLFTK